MSDDCFVLELLIAVCFLLHVVSNCSLFVSNFCYVVLVSLVVIILVVTATYCYYCTYLTIDCCFCFATAIINDRTERNPWLCVQPRVADRL